MKLFPISAPSITQKEVDYVTDAVRSGWVSSAGPYIEQFEKKYAEFIGVKHAISTSNGTTALHLSLLSYGIGKGDEVIVPDFSFIATANAVTYTGAVPVMVDVDPKTWNINPANIEKAISERTKAIIPVHIYGLPADMNSILDIAAKYNLLVIEDAAEAHGAQIGDRKVGGIGSCGVFSFYGNKIITTGEGGMITTNDDHINTRARYLRDHAMSKERRYWHPEVGYNYRMTNMQAALGLAQLERANEIIVKKQQIFSWYKSALNNVKGVTLNPEIEGVKNVYWMVCVLFDPSLHIDIDEFIVLLKNKGVDSRPFFYPMSSMPMYSSAGHDSPIANYLHANGINLPSGADLTEEDVFSIADTIKNLLSA